MEINTMATQYPSDITVDGATPEDGLLPRREPPPSSETTGIVTAKRHIIPLNIHTVLSGSTKAENAARIGGDNQCCDFDSSNTSLTAISIVGTRDSHAGPVEQISATDERVTLILLLNEWIAMYLALLQRLKCLCLRLPGAGASNAMACCNKVIVHVLVCLCRMLGEDVPKVSVERTKAIGHDWEAMICQASELRSWLDMRIGTYLKGVCLDEAYVRKYVCTEEVHDLIELSEKSRWIIADHVNADLIPAAERKRIRKLLDPKFSLWSYLKLVFGGCFYVKDVVTDWLAAMAHLHSGRILEAVLTMFFVHVAAFWVALRSCKSRSRIAIYTVLPVIPLRNNWRLVRLGIAMSDPSNSLMQRIRCRRRFKQIRSENAVLAFVRLTLEDLPQFLLQTQLLLRLMPESLHRNDDSISRLLGANWMIVLSISSSFLSICRTDVANIRNRAVETASSSSSTAMRGLAAKLATFAFITSFHGGFLIVLNLFLWQCPWCVIVPTMLAVALGGFAILVRGSCPTDEPFLTYLSGVCGSWKAIALAVTAAVRFAVRPLDVFSKWSDVLFCVMEIGLLATLYWLCSEEPHANTLLTVALFANVLWVAIFAVDRRFSVM